MVKFIYNHFYGMSLHHVVWIMGVMIIVWLGGAWIFQEKLQRHFWWKLINGFIVFGILGVIIAVTLSARNNTREVCLIPFYSLKAAQEQPELYRSMLMNVFLFFPLGLVLPYTLSDKWKHQVLVTILFALGLSVMIEFQQYYFCLGRAETDDVICNTVGALVGAIAFGRKK